MGKIREPGGREGKAQLTLPVGEETSRATLCSRNSAIKRVGGDRTIYSEVKKSPLPRGDGTQDQGIWDKRQVLGEGSRVGGKWVESISERENEGDTKIKQHQTVKKGANRK